MMYYDGEGVTQDYAEAFRWFREAWYRERARTH